MTSIAPALIIKLNDVVPGAEVFLTAMRQSRLWCASIVRCEELEEEHEGLLDPSRVHWETLRSSSLQLIVDVRGLAIDRKEKVAINAKERPKKNYDKEKDTLLQKFVDDNTGAEVSSPPRKHRKWRGSLLLLAYTFCLLYTSPSPRDQRGSRMPSSA